MQAILVHSLTPDLKNSLSYRFPKEAERRRGWLEVAQRDEGSLRMNSCLCSRHFEPSCFILGEDGQLTLSPDAIPTIIPVENEVTGQNKYVHIYLRVKKQAENISVYCVILSALSEQILDLS